VAGDSQQDDSEKTEEPTQKRLEDALKKGDVPKSQEVNTWFVMLAATMFIMVFATPMMSTLANSLVTFLSHPHEIPSDGEHLRIVFTEIASSVMGALWLPLGLLMVAAVVGNIIQHKPVFSAELITPKLSKISPLSGWKRLFSSQSLMNFVKGILKLAIVGTIMFLILWPERDRLDSLVSADINQLMPTLQSLAIKLMTGVVIVLTIIAAMDLAYQRFSWMKKQRMSHKELKDEYKQLEGDPTVKAKLKQLRAERGRKRMMAEVPDATVVVTNPTHFAVALKYSDELQAPICVAKGVEDLALKIREIAKEHDVPIVENPPLARTLHATVEIDDEVPPEHYKAVAQVIGYVMRLKPGRKRK